MNNGMIIGRCKVGPIEWDTFKSTFLDRIFPREMREPKLGEFINLKQGKLSIKENAF